jgi:hypothetical protein
MALIYFVWKYSRGNREDHFLALWGLGMFAAALFSRVHDGGYRNTLIPAYALLTVLFGVAFTPILEMLQHPRFEIVQPRVVNVFYLVCALQFVVLLYNPLALIPDEHDAAAGMQLKMLIEGSAGPVLVPNHGYLTDPSVDPPSAHSMAIEDVLRGTDRAIQDELLAEIRAVIAEQRYTLIVLDNDGWLDVDLESYYVRQSGIRYEGDEVFWPLTGKRVRPAHLYVPRN